MHPLVILGPTRTWSRPRIYCNDEAPELDGGRLFMFTLSGLRQRSLSLSSLHTILERPPPPVSPSLPSLRGSLMFQRLAANGRQSCKTTAIEDLSDDDLLAIFDFYAVEYQDVVFRHWLLDYYNTKLKIESWHSLVHVCRRWRGLVFASARRLNLQLCCITGQPQREAALDVWPALPLYILGGIGPVDGVIAELEHSNRIRQIDLYFNSTAQIEKLGAAIMHVPFPELTFLCLSFVSLCELVPVSLSYWPVLPDSFLGGSAPRLRSIYLTSISFPGLPKLLLSATYLVQLWLVDIPHSGYFSPEAMATCLSVLTSLKTLKLEFQSIQSSPDQESRRPPPSARSILPVLGSFSFKGVKEYLEELVVRIDAHQLRWLSTAFFNNIDFDAPELIQFIRRTPTVGTNDEARLIFRGCKFLVRFRYLPGPHDLEPIEVNISYQVPDWQLSSLAEICTSSLCLPLTMENLYNLRVSIFIIRLAG